MEIAILGTGNIGSTLGKKWLAAGQHVVFGARDAGSPKTTALAASLPEARILPVSAAIQQGEVILFSTPWAAVAEIAAQNSLGLKDRLLIDATNNFGGPVINNLATLEQTAPSAKIYRAFNSLGWEVFASPFISGSQVDMFYSGPDEDSRHNLEILITAIGLRPIWVGDNDRITLVDNLGALWVNMVFRQGWKRHTALKVITD